MVDRKAILLRRVYPDDRGTLPAMSTSDEPTPAPEEAPADEEVTADDTAETAETAPEPEAE